jgi:hypothetical protein
LAGLSQTRDLPEGNKKIRLKTFQKNSRTEKINVEGFFVEGSIIVIITASIL